jgi:gluconolactonase
MTLDLEDRLIVCGQGARRVTRTEGDGSITVLADRYEGKRFNGPNDVVVHSSGAIYFTDPPWGLRDESERELPFHGVYRIDANGGVRLVVDNMVNPNGLAFSLDERLLYVGDDATGDIQVFDVSADGGLSNKRLFAHTPLPSPLAADESPPDGMKIDSEGNLYATSIGGVWIFDPAGKALGRINMPEVAANLGWGGEEWHTLFITATTSLYRLRLNVPGCPVGSARRTRST